MLRCPVQCPASLAPPPPSRFTSNQSPSFQPTQLAWF
ncbi:hypothetical protein GQ607_013704 [Colletotrichum asianum]|uniref:Uncharacterized protein n=1 Tax=Colletotrichum asianum TaxID=702518 RepID=A0A8H3W6D4_9PEZI|nr:hypothetical protein GQ607_013704 [Colletotrichum asianum]